MPKNPYQRPQKVFTSHAVPRHGAPVPAGKAGTRKPLRPKPEDGVPLPPLEALLARDRHKP